MDAPLNAAEAAKIVSDRWEELFAQRDEAQRLDMIHRRLKTLHHKARAAATLDPALDGLTVDKRKESVVLATVGKAHRELASRLADELGLGKYVPEVVEDLAWLRERSEAMAEAGSAAAYDAREHLGAWRGVNSFAKVEAELAPPHERGVAA